jgi:hypothetical protein
MSRRDFLKHLGFHQTPPTMSKSNILHYAGYDPPTESDNSGYWTETLCGYEYENVTNDESEVTCNNCLRKIKKANDANNDTTTAND